MPSPSPVPVVGEARAVCTIPLDRLQKLASSVLPLLNNEPVAVQKGGETCFYMVSPAMFSQLQMRLPLQEAEQPSPTRFVTGAEVNDSPTVAAVAERLLLDEGLRAERGAMSQASVGILRNRLKLHILPLMGTLPVHMVDADAVQHLVKRLSDRGSSPTTLSQYLVIVRKLLKLAFSRKWIRELPELPKINIDSRPRAAFTLPQYKAVLRSAKQLARSGAEAPMFKMGTGTRSRFWITQRYQTLPPDLYWVMVFMVNSFVRPSDIKILQHQHVQVVRGPYTYLRLSMPATKKHDKPVVTLPSAVRIYEAIRRANPSASASDYLFLPEEKNRDHALAVLNFWFKWVMREASIALTDTHGQARTLYCLRHTGITFRLLYGQGIDMLTLARNARTSVDMIENFYASTLSGEMNVGMLQSRRDTTQKKTPGVATRG